MLQGQTDLGQKELFCKRETYQNRAHLPKRQYIEHAYRTFLTLQMQQRQTDLGKIGFFAKERPTEIGLIRKREYIEHTYNILLGLSMLQSQTDLGKISILLYLNPGTCVCTKQS